MGRKVRLRFAIESHYLLTPRMRHSCENARLRNRRIVFVTENARDRNPFVAEGPEQRPASFVIAHDPNRKNVHPEVREIVYRVGSAARNHGPLPMTKNQDRSFTGDARDFAE